MGEAYQDNNISLPRSELVFEYELISLAWMYFCFCRIGIELVPAMFHVIGLVT